MKRKWTVLDEDDFVLQIGATGILRVEQMDRNNWWCAVTFQGREIWNQTGYKTCKIAKQTALRIYQKARLNF